MTAVRRGFTSSPIVASSAERRLSRSRSAANSRASRSSRARSSASATWSSRFPSSGSWSASTGGMPSSRARPAAAITASCEATGWNCQSARWTRLTPRPDGSPVLSVRAAAARSLGASAVFAGALATTRGLSRPVTSTALHLKSPDSSCTASAAISCSPREDRSRRASPAIVALRPAWASARRACSRIEPARWLVTSATANSTITVTTSPGLWISRVR